MDRFFLFLCFELLKRELLGLLYCTFICRKKKMGVGEEDYWKEMDNNTRVLLAGVNNSYYYYLQNTTDSSYLLFYLRFLPISSKNLVLTVIKN